MSRDAGNVDTTTPTHPKPDADPAAYTCEWCEEETADGFTWDAGEWCPSCEACRDLWP